MFLVRPTDVEVRDTWHVDGMVATGSRDIVANALYVPGAQHVVAARRRAVSAGDDATYLMRFPVPPFLSLTAAIPSVGAARRAVELYPRVLIAERVPFGTNKTTEPARCRADAPRNRARGRARGRDGAARASRAT